MSENIYEWVRDRFGEILEISPEAITPASQFAEDLDADSIDLIEVVNQAEARWGVAVDEEQIYDLETVGELVEVLRANLDTKG